MSSTSACRARRCSRSRATPRSSGSSPATSTAAPRGGSRVPVATSATCAPPGRTSPCGTTRAGSSSSTGGPGARSTACARAATPPMPWVPTGGSSPSAASSSASRPRAPRTRTCTRSPVSTPRPYSLAVAGTRIVFEEILSRSTGRLVVLRPNGKRRAISPRMPLGGDGIDFDGHSVVFVSGGVRLRRPGPGGDADRPAAALLITDTRAGRRRPRPARTRRSARRSTPRRPCGS